MCYVRHILHSSIASMRMLALFVIFTSCCQAFNVNFQKATHSDVFMRDSSKDNFSFGNFAKILKSSITAATCASILCTSSLPANSGALSASELFSMAESAIEKTDENYKTVLTEWGQSRKILAESMKPVTQTDELLKTVSKDLSGIAAKISASAEDVNAATALISSQIEVLTADTAAKFDAAEEASKAGLSPAKIAKQFSVAESAAAVLAQEGALLQKYKDTAAGVSAALTKANEARASADATVEKMNRLARQQAEGEALLAGGVDTSVKFCRDTLSECSSKQQDGVTQFRAGQTDVRKAAAGLAKEISDIKNNQRKVESLAAEVELLSSRLQVQLEDVAKWQDTAHMRLPTLPPSKPITDKLRDADKTAVSVLERFVRAKELVAEKNNRARAEALDKELNRVEKLLSTAQEEGKRAYSLLTSAKASGDRESAKYIAKVPKSTSAKK